MYRESGSQVLRNSARTPRTPCTLLIIGKALISLTERNSMKTVGFACWVTILLPMAVCASGCVRNSLARNCTPYWQSTAVHCTDVAVVTPMCSPTAAVPTSSPGYSSEIGLLRSEVSSLGTRVEKIEQTIANP